MIFSHSCPRAKSPVVLTVALARKKENKEELSRLRNCKNWVKEKNTHTDEWVGLRVCVCVCARVSAFDVKCTWTRGYICRRLSRRVCGWRPSRPPICLSAPTFTAWRMRSRTPHIRHVNAVWWPPGTREAVGESAGKAPIPTGPPLASAASSAQEQHNEFADCVLYVFVCRISTTVCLIRLPSGFLFNFGAKFPILKFEFSQRPNQPPSKSKWSILWYLDMLWLKFCDNGRVRRLWVLKFEGNINKYTIFAMKP